MRKTEIMIVFGIMLIFLVVTLTASAQAPQTNQPGDSIYPSVGGEILPLSLLHNSVLWVTVLSSIAIIIALLRSTVWKSQAL